MQRLKNRKIVYIFDDSFYHQFLTVTNSILKNEKQFIANSIEFYITYFGSEESIPHLLRSAKLHFPNNTFYLKHVPSEFPELTSKYEKFYDFRKSASHIQTSSVLCRFDLDLIWSEVNDKILYLDLDLIVKGSISDLFDSVDEFATISACRSEKTLGNEIRFLSMKDQKPPHFYLNEFRHNFKYTYYRYIGKDSVKQKIYDQIMSTDYNFSLRSFNAGVFCLDLKKYRENLELKSRANFFIEINKYGALFRHNDQSILNMIFYNQIDFIDPMWNALDYGWHNKEYEARSRKNFWNAKIIHYNGPQKPWLFGDVSLVPNYFQESFNLWKKYKL